MQDLYLFIVFSSDYLEIYFHSGSRTAWATFSLWIIQWWWKACNPSQAPAKRYLGVDKAWLADARADICLTQEGYYADPPWLTKSIQMYYLIQARSLLQSVCVGSMVFSACVCKTLPFFPVDHYQEETGTQWPANDTSYQCWAVPGLYPPGSTLRVHRFHV